MIAREDVAGEKRLVAYFTARETGVCPSARGAEGVSQGRVAGVYGAERFRRARCPTADPQRQARPPRAAHATRAASNRPRGPADATEVRLAAIWSEVLRAPLIGRGDDFFALGGGLAARPAGGGAHTDRFHIELPLKELFDQPTLQSLCRLHGPGAGRRGNAKDGALGNPSSGAVRHRCRNCTAAHVAIQSLNPANTAWTWRALWLGELDVAAACASFDELIARRRDPAHASAADR